MDVGKGLEQWFDGRLECGRAFFTLRTGEIGGEKIGQQLLAFLP